MQMFKRLSGMAMLAVATVVVTAGSALAETTTYPVNPSSGSSVEGAGGGTAFTGSSQVPLGALMVLVFVALGVTALLVARRRAARLAG